jgi:pyridoxine/pyridoxamine 5'-phosphate oxidase
MTPELHPWAADLSDLYAQVWTRLVRGVRGVRDRRAPTRHPTLATVTLDGKPQARTVVLRAADKITGTLDIHTDLYASKVVDLRAAPFAALHVWDAGAHLQMRLEATVTILTGADVAATWAGVSDASRQSYGSLPAPGKPIAQSLDYAKQPNPESFAILRLTVQKIDTLHLGGHHRRARFDRDAGWSGTWLAP